MDKDWFKFRWVKEEWEIYRESFPQQWKEANKWERIGMVAIHIFLLLSLICLIGIILNSLFLVVVLGWCLFIIYGIIGPTIEDNMNARRKQGRGSQG